MRGDSQQNADADAELLFLSDVGQTGEIAGKHFNYEVCNVSAIYHYQNVTRAAPVITLFFLIHFLPFLINGNNTYIRIHDNLEGEWLWRHLLVTQEKALDFSPHSTIEGFMNGQLRATFPSGLSLPVLCIWLFGSYWGYIINYFFLHLLAFFGMHVLLRKHFLTEEKDSLTALGVSLCFSVVPFYAEFGVAGLPWLLLSFLNIFRNNETWGDFLHIILFPLYSSLAWAGISAIVAMGIFLLINCFLHRTILGKLALGITLLTVTYIIVNYSMLSLTFLNDDFISHRTGYDIFALQEISFRKALLDTIYPLLFTHYHVGTVVTIPVMLTAGAAWYYSGKDSIILRLLAIIIIICFAYGFYVYAAYLLGEIFPLLITFKANRFTILLPLLFFLLFAISLKKILESGLPRYSVMLLLGCQLAIGFASNDEWLHNIRNLSGFQVKPGYKEYYAESLFKEIEVFIGEPKSSYRIASLGINPAVSQYNGFHTLDGLQAIYSRKHKEQFREIIAPELEKNMEVKNYFDAWGNRCYLFAASLGIADRNFLIGKSQQIVLNDFSLNTEAFKKMGGKYIFSGLKIQAPEQQGLRLLKVFEHDKGWWRVYLYGVK